MIRSFELEKLKSCKSEHNKILYLNYTYNLQFIYLIYYNSDQFISSLNRAHYQATLLQNDTPYRV